MRDRILSFLDYARALVLLAAGAGILIYLDPHAANPLEPKTFSFAAGAGFFVALTAMRLWWGGKIWLPPSPLRWALLALAATQFLAFYLSASAPRSEDVFNAWLLLLLLVLAAGDYLQQEPRQDALLRAVAAALALASVWGLAQLLGLNLGPLDEDARQAFGSRISAGFGNPNFLGGFLVLALPVTLWLSRRNAWGWGLLGLGAFAVIATGSKAAWMGLGFEYFCYGHFHWHGPRPRQARLVFLKRWAALGLIAAALGFALLPSARQRLMASFNPANESVQFRIQTWKGALAAFGARPIFGHGPGSFSAVYPAFRPPIAMASQVQHSYEVTHPENWVLQMLVESGLLGLAALGFCLWLLLKPLWIAALGDDQLALALFLGLGGSLTANLASLDLFLPSTFFFFALLAALALLRYGGKTASLGFKAAPFAALFLCVCLFLFACFPALQSFAKWRASCNLSDAKTLSEAGKFDDAVPDYDQALLGDPVNTEALYFKGASLLDGGHPDQALPVFEELQKLAPDYVLVHDKKARAYKAVGQGAAAAAEWERQLQLDPWLMPVVQELSGLYASQGKLEDAERVLLDASVRFPDDKDLARNLTTVKAALAARH